MKRFIWCSTADELVYGKAFRKELATPTWWQRLLRIKYEKGTYYQFAEVTLSDALMCFERFLAAPGNFSVETKEGCRIDFCYRRGSSEVFLDIWPSDVEFEDAVIPITQAEKLLGLIFQDTSDTEIAALIRSLRTDP